MALPILSSQPDDPNIPNPESTLLLYSETLFVPTRTCQSTLGFTQSLQTSFLSLYFSIFWAFLSLVDPIPRYTLQVLYEGLSQLYRWRRVGCRKQNSDSHPGFGPSKPQLKILFLTILLLSLRLFLPYNEAFPFFSTLMLVVQSIKFVKRRKSLKIKL